MELQFEFELWFELWSVETVGRVAGASEASGGVCVAVVV